MAENTKIEIAAVETTIENEISQGATRKTIAQTYALALRSSWPTDWQRVNRAIIKRWSVAGMLWIKKHAHAGTCFTTPGDKCDG